MNFNAKMVWALSKFKRAHRLSWVQIISKSLISLKMFEYYENFEESDFDNIKNFEDFNDPHEF